MQNRKSNFMKYLYLFITIIFSLIIFYEVNNTAEKKVETIKNQMASIDNNCKNIASYKLKIKIIENNTPLDKDEIKEILKPYNAMDRSICQEMNNQLMSASLK